RNYWPRTAILRLQCRTYFIGYKQTCLDPANAAKAYHQQITKVRRGHPMSWITIVWSMNAAACLTLAAIYLLVWCKQRQDPAHLLFSVTAVAAAAIAAFELEMMHAETVGQYEALMRWIHVPVWVLVISFVSFVRLYLHAGRRWLAWSICGLRTLVLILNFV